MRPRFRLSSFVLSLLLLAFPLDVRAAGYTFYRVVIWGRPGEQPPRFQQDSASGGFVLVFPGPAPEAGWDPVPARRLEVHGGAFLPVDPVTILRPRDPDPDWDTASLENSLDLNRDGRAEIVRGRTVMVPDRRDPSASQQRVLVDVLEGDQVVFIDLLEGPSSGSVRVHSVFSTDFTGEGFPDLVVLLEADDRTGAAFYSQKALRFAGDGTRRIDGSSAAFRCDGYGIFDLNRSPRDFFSRLPSSARPDQPGCPDIKGVEGDGLAHCRYRFDSAYLGWISEFHVGFLPSRSLKIFDLYFPGQSRFLTPEQALAFLLPIFGGEYQVDTKSRRNGVRDLTWQWKGKGTTATLRAVESSGQRRSIALRLERR